MQLIIETGKAIENANSYIGIVDVEKYMISKMYSDFIKLSEDDQIDSMVTASLFIDSAFSWAGKQKTLEQGLSFPRTGIIFQDHIIPDDFIPMQVKRACVAAINLIMRFDITFFTDTGEAQIKKEKMVVFETEYFENLKKCKDSSEFSDINNILRGFYYFPVPTSVLTAEVLRK